MPFEWNASIVKIPLKNSRIINKYALARVFYKNFVRALNSIYTIYSTAEWGGWKSTGI